MAIVLSILENTLTGMMNFAIPGVKPGLSNLAVVLALAFLGGGYGFVVALIKATASFLATGAVTVLWFSLAGSLLSMGGMWLVWKLCRKTFTWAGISALGGLLSNIGQVLVMMALSETVEFLYYLPFLAISGVFFGFVVGVLANLILARMSKIKGLY